jgi:hypothetical protein
VLGVSALALAADSAQAQNVSRPDLLGSGRLEFDGYFTHYRLDADNDRMGVDGVGGRLSWRPVSGDVVAIPSRFAFGAFIEFTPKGDDDFQTFHTGLQSDFRLFRTPWLGRIDPLISLGAGAFHTDSEVRGSVHLGREFPLARRDKTTAFALSPSVGTRLHVWRTLGVRADLRDVITFKGETLHNWQIAAGLTFPF